MCNVGSQPKEIHDEQNLAWAQPVRTLPDFLVTYSRCFTGWHTALDVGTKSYACLLLGIEEAHASRLTTASLDHLKHHSSVFHSQLRGFWEKEFLSIGSQGCQSAKLENPCRGLARLQRVHTTCSGLGLWLRPVTPPKALYPESLCWFFWPQMNSAHWRTAVIPSTHNFPLAKINQGGWVWGQQLPEGRPPTPTHTKKNIKYSC